MDQTPRPDESRDDSQDHQRDLDAEFAALMERYLGASIEVRAVVDRAHPELVIEP